MITPNHLYRALQKRYNVELIYRNNPGLSLLRSKLPDNMIAGVYFFFPNGYGASIIRNHMSYGHDDGLFELAVLTGTGENDSELCYDTPITDDVLGHLTLEEVLENVDQIRDLPLLEEAQP